MGVIRVEHNTNYTVMGNVHLRDQTLSLRAVGLMSRMLSLPDSWAYSVTGLAEICKEGREAVRKCLMELEAAGYLVRQQNRQGGHFAGYDYTLYEVPQDRDPDRCPDFWATADPPLPKIPLPRNPSPENPPELSKDQQVTPPYSPPEGDPPPETPTKARERRSREIKLTPDWKPERFEKFWHFYPALPDGNGHARRPKKDRAVAAWDRLKPDDETIRRMGLALIRQKESQQWKDGIGIPYASTWLNSRAWEEEYEDADAEPQDDEAPERKLVGERC